MEQAILQYQHLLWLKCPFPTSYAVFTQLEQIVNVNLFKPAMARLATGDGDGDGRVQRWPAWFVSDFPAAGPLMYHRGEIALYAGAQRLALTDVEGRRVDSRSLRTGEEVVPCTTIEFPCHLVRVGYDERRGEESSLGDELDRGEFNGGIHSLSTSGELLRPHHRVTLPSTQQPRGGSDGGGGGTMDEKVRREGCAPAGTAARDRHLVLRSTGDGRGGASGARLADGGRRDRSIREGGAQAHAGGATLGHGAGGLARSCDGAQVGGLHLLLNDVSGSGNVGVGVASGGVGARSASPGIGSRPDSDPGGGGGSKAPEGEQDIVRSRGTSPLAAAEPGDAPLGESRAAPRLESHPLLEKWL